MINSIGLKNIRVFKDWQEFTISPLTILTGTNNSGKSTFQKVLILLATGMDDFDKELVDIDNIYFKKEFIELIGDFDNNISYDSGSNSLFLSFCFTDEFYGDIRTELKYEKGKNSLAASIRQLDFIKDGEIILTYDRINAKEKVRKKITGNSDDNKDMPILFWDGDDYSWRISPENWKNWNDRIRDIILQKKNRGLIEKRLIELDRKIKEGKVLNVDELELKGKYEAEGLEFNSENVFEYPGSPGMFETSHHVWDINGKDQFKIHQNAKHISEVFNSIYEEILIPSPLVDLVLGKENILFTSNENVYASVRKSLNDFDIYNKEQFIEAYRSFELVYMYYSTFDKLKYYETLEDEVSYSSFSFKDLCRHASKSGLVSDPICSAESFKQDIISKIMLRHNLSPFKFNPSTNKILFEGYESYNSSDDKPNSIENQIKEIRNEYVYLLRQFSTHLSHFNRKIDFSLQNHTIKRHFLVTDVNSVDSPFLDFGFKYLNKEIDEQKIRFINSWLKEFNIGDSFDVMTIEINKVLIGVSYHLNKNNKCYPIGDSGRGINQLMLLIFKIAITGYSYGSKDSLMIFEEPETNLHPALQSKLADLFIDAYKKFKISFIVETHSEYLIRKLQYRVGESSKIINLVGENMDLESVNISSMKWLCKILKIQEDEEINFIKKSIRNHIISNQEISVFYVYNPFEVPIGKSQVEKLEIRPDGIIKQDFGSGFFDEAANLTFDLLRLISNN